MVDYSTKSFWLGLTPYQENPPLQGELRVDVAIIGGGFTGIATAYFLKQAAPSLHVVVLESHVVGFGASGRNGGFSMTLFGLTMGTTAFRFGKDKARQAQHYMERAVDLVDQLVKEHNIDCDYEYNGFLRVATTPTYARRIQKEIKLAESLGIEGIEWLDAKRTREQVNSPLYLGAWREPRCAILNPAKLVRGMKKVAEQCGAVVYERTPVQEYHSGPKLRLVTPQGAVIADKVVFATNAFSSFFPQLRSRQIPIHTHIILTEPLRPEHFAEIGWQNRQGIEDARNFVHYYRLTSDNRLLVGGERTQYYYGNRTDIDEHRPTYRVLERFAHQAYPCLQDLRVAHHWGGPVSGTLDFAPMIGYLGRDKRVVYSLGCMGHGVSLSHLNGQTLSDLILERQTERTEVFFVNRRYIPLPAEPFRFAITNAVLDLMRVQDWWDESKGLGKVNHTDD